MAKKTKKEKVVEKKCDEGIVDTILKGVSYGTGVLVRKAADIGKVGETKPWKKVVAKTEDLYEKVNANTRVMFKRAGKSVKENISEMKDSFKEGIKSVSSETKEGERVNSEIKTEEIPASKKTPSSIAKKGAISIKGQSTDTIKIKGAIQEISGKREKSSSAQKTKNAPKKSQSKMSAEKEASVDADLEKEIEKTTRDVKEI